MHQQLSCANNSSNGTYLGVVPLSTSLSFGLVGGAATECMTAQHNKHRLSQTQCKVSIVTLYQCSSPSMQCVGHEETEDVVPSIGHSAITEKLPVFEQNTTGS